jgi:membrane protein
VKKYTGKIFQFIRNGIWTVDVSQLSQRNRYFVKFLRIIILAIENFQAKNLILQASALTFYSLLSIVPVAAMIFGIAKGFGLEERLRQELFNSFEHQPELLEQVLGFVNGLLANTQGGLVAGFGFILLLWSVLQVLSNIEESFNSIWQITTNRTWIRKFTDYLAIMLIAPIFIISSGSASIYISLLIKNLTENWIAYPLVKNLVFFSINLIPYFLSALLFSLVYTVIPNTRVKLKPAVLAGIVAGFSFQLFQWGYVAFQVGVSRYNAIYGSFAFFPLFITFLQLSWVIVLIGAEISYSLQNIKSHVDERKVFAPNPRQRLVLALAIITEAVKRFHRGEPPPGNDKISDALGLPYKAVKELCNDLCLAGLLSKVLIEGKSEPCYQPAVDPELIHLSYIIEKLETLRGVPETEFSSPGLAPYERIIASLYSETGKSACHIPIIELVGKAGA